MKPRSQARPPASWRSPGTAKPDRRQLPCHKTWWFTLPINMGTRSRTPPQHSRTAAPVEVSLRCQPAPTYPEMRPSPTPHPASGAVGISASVSGVAGRRISLKQCRDLNSGEPAHVPPQRSTSRVRLFFLPTRSIGRSWLPMRRHCWHSCQPVEWYRQQ
jgi:hypothetical protein